MEIKKSEYVDLEKRKTTSLLIGLVFALAVLFMALEWTQREIEDNSEIYAMGDLVLEQELVPLTQPEKKTVPPPPAAVKQSDVLEIVKDDADIEETVMQSEEDNTEWVDLSGMDVVEVEEYEEPDEVFMVVEDDPEFPGGYAALQKYLRDHIKYPPVCRENNIQGRVILQFVVNKDGSIVEPEVIKGVNTYLDKEALRVVSEMPKWTPGKQRGREVRVKFTLPVQFKLN